VRAGHCFHGPYGILKLVTSGRGHMKIAIFVGSLRRDSVNKKLARNLELAVPDDVNVVYVDIQQPLFNADNEQEMPQSVQQMKAIVEEADGVLFVTPEYNRSMPGVLKNAIDWVSRPDNSFRDKPAGITGATYGSLGTLAAQISLFPVLHHLGMRVMTRPELYFNFAGDKLDSGGKVVDDYHEQLQGYMDAFIRHIHHCKH
jgi:chromate reductase, NAD(P)H dehydrogenase (quinone)